MTGLLSCQPTPDAAVVWPRADRLGPADSCRWWASPHFQLHYSDSGWVSNRDCGADQQGWLPEGVAEWDGKATGKRGEKRAEEVRAALGWTSRRLIPPDRSTPAKARPARVSSPAVRYLGKPSIPRQSLRR